MYEPITSSKDSDDLYMGFDRIHNGSSYELSQNKNVKGKYHLRIRPRGVFGFAECQEKATYDLGYKLTLTRNKDDAVLVKVGGIADARIKIDHIHRYVGHNTPSIQQQSFFVKTKF